MGNKKNNKRVSAIVPAYNEEERIGAVLEILTTYNKFIEVIVIDDGSTDKTQQIAKQYPVKYIKNKTNKGKGYSMDKAVQIAKGDIVFFCDADVRGLAHNMIDDIIAPVVEDKLEMMIGMRNRKIYYTSFILTFVPLLGGERALTKKLWNTVPLYFKNRFRIEAGLNFYAKYYGKGHDFKVFEQLQQTIKEKKYGFMNGVKQRIGMFKDIIAAQMRLEFIDIPKNVRNKRLMILNSLTQTTGILIGLATIIAAKIGPIKFIMSLFQKELIEDPDAPLIHVLLKIAHLTTNTTLLSVGIIILILNLTFLIMSLFHFLRLKKIKHNNKVLNNK